MADPSLLLNRPIFLTREGSVFRLGFDYKQEIVEMVRRLPYSNFDPETKTWTTLACEQSVDQLREMFTQGLTDVYVDSLLAEGEVLERCKDATLHSGTVRRPFIVTMAHRGDNLYSRLRSIPGGQWDKPSNGMSFGPQASTALAELASRGIIDDPDKLLSPADVVVAFDGRTGKFAIRGDQRAQVAFDAHFPHKDVMALWLAKGIDVAFADEFSEEIYRGELARVGPGLQPVGMKLPLFEYQAQNVAVAVERSGLGVWDMPGLGKTPAAIGTAVEVVLNRKQAVRALIVVPGAVRTQWAREIARFVGLPTDAKGMPTQDVVIIDGDKKKRTRLYEEAKAAKWVIVNYDVLHLDYKMISPLASGALLIADEAHRCKSPTAKRTKALRQLGARAAKRLALSGTPVENEPGEWFSLISGFVMPGSLGSPTDFLGRYQYPNRWGGYEGARNLGELRDRSKVYYVRHTKAEVAKHLPPLRVQHLQLDVDGSLAAALRRAHREARDEIKQASIERVNKITGGVLPDDAWEDVETGAEMTAVGMLRLMCSSPRLLALSESDAARALVESGLVPEEDGPKLDELRTRAAEMQAAGERLVVFTFSKRMANLISERLKSDGIRHVTFTGETSSDDRDAAVLAFTTAGTDDQPGPTVFVATDAAAEGLNLGRCCSTLMNFDIPWTPGRLEQRSNRIHRVDGTSPQYLVINLTMSGTIEQGILRMVETKADLQDAIFGESGGRKKTTGRGGRSIFDQVMEDWDKENS